MLAFVQSLHFIVFFPLLFFLQDHSRPTESIFQLFADDLLMVVSQQSRLFTVYHCIFGIVDEVILTLGGGNCHSPDHEAIFNLIFLRTHRGILEQLPEGIFSVDKIFKTHGHVRTGLSLRRYRKGKPFFPSGYRFSLGDICEMRMCVAKISIDFFIEEGANFDKFLRKREKLSPPDAYIAPLSPLAIHHPICAINISWSKKGRAYERNNHSPFRSPSSKEDPY